MTTLHHEIRIEAPLEAVWNAISDLAAVKHYNPTVVSAWLLSPLHEGIGAARRCELKPKGWVEERVWEWSPRRSIGLEVTASEWPLVFMKWKTELQIDGNVTLVRQTMNYKLKFGLLGALIDALVMRRKLRKTIGEVFENMKRHVETSPR